MCLAIPGKIISIENQDDISFKKAKVSFGGIIKEINLGLVPDAMVGEYVLVHVGVAISKVDEEEAKITLGYLQQMGEIDEIQNDAIEE
jgi:hydrogenase expression/formation protein HypC